MRELKIGFVNGCFDLLHDGHKYFIDRAASHCDRLFVGVNTDESVRRLKGDGRPVQLFAERCTHVFWATAAFAVRPYSDELLSKLMEEIRPHVIIRGWDQDMAAPEGIEVIRLPRLGTYSTTRSLTEQVHA